MTPLLFEQMNGLRIVSVVATTFVPAPATQIARRSAAGVVLFR